MNLPNLITIIRICMVPVIVYLILIKSFLPAFLLFAAAGASDGIDGFIARHFGMQTELGGYLDPIADKTLMASIYIALALAGEVPLWLVIAVVSRDILIVGGVLLAWLMGKPVEMHPLPISKMNTAAQIIYAALVLGNLGLVQIEVPGLQLLAFVVGILTIASAIFYMAAWTRHMAPDAGR